VEGGVLFFFKEKTAYEVLSKRSVSADAPAARPSEPAPREQAPTQDRAPRRDQPGAGTSDLATQVSEILWGTKRRQGMVEAMAKQAARTVGRQIGRQIP